MLKGAFGVAINEEHFKDLLFEAVPPPATRRKPGATTSQADLMLMGFPSLLSTKNATLCACHSKLRPNGFVCPRCSSKICEVPTDCSICNLTVVASPHLARSYRHLFPVANYLEVNGYADVCCLFLMIS
jgi:transcription initiation factor TFIIH subunit 2